MNVQQHSDEQDWADNPRLNTWLAAQEAAFPAWAQQTGQQWDFTPDSLDRLEDHLRRRFSSRDEVKAAEEDPAATVPAWYLGEVQNRHHGTMWKRRPHPPQDFTQGDGTPFVILPKPPRDAYEQALAEEHGELYRDEDYLPVCHPVSEIRALFLRGPDNRLRDILDQYARYARLHRR